MLTSALVAAVALMPVALTACGDSPEDIEARIAAASSVKLVNYLGNSQNIHPKVLYFPQGWGGHRFWMAYTPYPDGKISCENPCIAVSEDGYHWTAPDGLTNPLATAPRGGYNSDTHLVHNTTDNTLECWWRVYDIESRTDWLVRRTSHDGVMWSDPETVMERGERGVMRLSPTVHVRDGRYEMVYCDGARLWLVRAASHVPAIDWEEPVKIDCPDWHGLMAWHLDFISDGAAAVAVVCCYEANGGSNNSTDLYTMDINLDSATVSEPVLLLGRRTSGSPITSRAIYRSSIVDVEGRLYLYFSSIDRDWHRHLDLRVL